MEGSTHMSRILKSRRAKLLVGLVAALSVTAVALAYWTNGGTGSGTASTGNTSDNLTITATGWGGLVPGDSKDVSVTLSNPNTFTSHVKKVTLDPAHAGTEADGTADGIDTGVASTANGTRCLSSWFHYTDATVNDNVAPQVEATPGSATFAGGSGGSGAKLAFDDLTANTAAANQDGCKLASVKLYLKVDN